MTFAREQEIKIGEKDFYIIDVLKHEGDTYLYVQEIENDELIDRYYVYKYDDTKGGMVHVKENEKLGKLLKMFAENIRKDI